MDEPRGRAAMSGAILQAPTRPDADWGVVGSRFTGRLLAETAVAGLSAVTSTVTGRAWVIGIGQYLLDPTVLPHRLPVLTSLVAASRAAQTLGTCQSPVARYCTFLAIETAWSANRSW